MKTTFKILFAILAIPLAIICLLLLIPCGILVLLWILLMGRRSRLVVSPGTPPPPRPEPSEPKDGRMHETVYDIEYTVVSEKSEQEDKDKGSSKYLN